MSMKSILENAQSSRALVSVYVDSDDWGQYSVGFVDVVSETHVRLRAVSKNGESAGFEIRALTEIFKIESGGKYEHKIEKLNQSQGKVFKEVNPKDESSGDLIFDALQQSLNESIVIVLWGNDPDDSLVGYVEMLDAKLVSLRLINEFGEDDGLSSIEIDEIMSIDFNTQSEQVRKYLYQDKK